MGTEGFRTCQLAKRGAEVYRIAFEKEKELTDRALNLAEAGKPKSNWELQGLLGMAAFVNSATISLISVCL